MRRVLHIPPVVAWRSHRDDLSFNLYFHEKSATRVFSLQHSQLLNEALRFSPVYDLRVVVKVSASLDAQTA